jgi:hypothetical protein
MGIITDFYNKLINGERVDESSRGMQYPCGSYVGFFYAILCMEKNSSKEESHRNQRILEKDFGNLKYDEDTKEKQIKDRLDSLYAADAPEKLRETEAHGRGSGVSEMWKNMNEVEKKTQKLLRDGLLKKLVSFLCSGKKPDSEKEEKSYALIIRYCCEIFQARCTGVRYENAKIILNYLELVPDNEEDKAAFGLYSVIRYAYTKERPIKLKLAGHEKLMADTVRFSEVLRDNMVFNLPDMLKIIKAMATPLDDKTPGNCVALGTLILLEAGRIRSDDVYSIMNGYERIMHYIEEMERIDEFFPVPLFYRSYIESEYIRYKGLHPDLYIEELERKLKEGDAKYYADMKRRAQDASYYGIGNANNLLGDLYLDGHFLAVEGIDPRDKDTINEKRIEEYKKGKKAGNVLSAYKAATLLESVGMDGKEEYEWAAAGGNFASVIRLIDIMMEESTEKSDKSKLAGYIRFASELAGLPEEMTEIGQRIVAYCRRFGKEKVAYLIEQKDKGRSVLEQLIIYQGGLHNRFVSDPSNTHIYSEIEECHNVIKWMEEKLLNGTKPVAK